MTVYFLTNTFLTEISYITALIKQNNVDMNRAIRHWLTYTSTIPLKAHFIGWERMSSNLPVTEFGNKYAVVFMDYLTKWVEAFAVPDQTAGTIVRHIIFVGMETWSISCQIEEQTSSVT